LPVPLRPFHPKPAIGEIHVAPFECERYATEKRISPENPWRGLRSAEVWQVRFGNVGRRGSRDASRNDEVP
jgi:hypothetical protein